MQLPIPNEWQFQPDKQARPKSERQDKNNDQRDWVRKTLYITSPYSSYSKMHWHSGAKRESLSLRLRLILT